MQQAIPFKSWQPLYNTTNTTLNLSSTKLIKGSNNYHMGKMVSENAVIVFARRGCCMSHVVKRLLLGLGVNPAVYEVDEEDDVGVLAELGLINKGNGIDQKVQFPAVFIGGKLFGGLDRIMATHISGELIPVLKEAKALWL
ncbi:glutaredoxin-C9-like isoform X2 [Pistacia vera]|uniref:glutaredoxin-C9-like isoform X2 n=1 Tax=Pistacia vera TaxID=55513 RepID=UPI001263AD59|nr:glutaredoxin-C9-like isoform X2 [Pistacia vera]